jgi:MarR family transcriptional regulator, transcriptional regulator for hemolysin
MNATDPWKPSIGTLLHEVTRLLRRRFEEEAKRHGLTLAQWRAMVTIHKQDGITQVALAAYIDCDAMTLSGILDRLDKRGLIERIVHPDDSRAKQTRLTPAGQSLMAQSQDVAAQVFFQALEGLDEQARQALTESLMRIRTNLSSQEPSIVEIGKPAE